MKRILFINMHVILLCIGTIANAAIFCFCWPRCHGLYAGASFIGVLVIQWFLTLLTQRSGALWIRKRYTVAHICCYVLLAIVMSIEMMTKPIFHAEDAIISPVVDSIFFTTALLFFSCGYSLIIGYILKNKVDTSDDLLDYYCYQNVYPNETFF